MGIGLKCFHASTFHVNHRHVPNMHDGQLCSYFEYIMFQQQRLDLGERMMGMDITLDSQRIVYWTHKTITIMNLNKVQYFRLYYAGECVRGNSPSKQD